MTGTGPTKEEVRAVVWGPYRFTPGVDEADRDGRTVNSLLMQRQDAGQLPVGETLLCQMDRTRSPRWYAGGQDGWERDFPTTSPVRLRISCRRDEDHWTVAEQTTFTPSRSQ